METNGQPKERTWDDVGKEIDAAQVLPTCEKPDGSMPPPPPATPGHDPHGGHGGRPRVGKGRLTVYLLLTVLLNILLAIFALFVLGVSVEAVRELLTAGSVESWPRLILLVLIMISPLFLTILLNRLLYRSMRGRGRFPRGIWLFAAVLVLLVQAATIYVAFTAGAAPALESFEVQSFTTAEY